MGTLNSDHIMCAVYKYCERAKAWTYPAKIALNTRNVQCVNDEDVPFGCLL